MCVLVTQSCPTLCDPLNYSLPGFSVHGILQAGLPFPPPKKLSNPGITPSSPSSHAYSLLFELQGSLLI